MSASRPAGRRARGLVAAWIACAACGAPAQPARSTLAPAGSARDRESGILARLSAGRAAPAVPRRPEPAAPGPRRAGGSPYADYRFDPPDVSYALPEPYEDGYRPATPAEVGMVKSVTASSSPRGRRFL